MKQFMVCIVFIAFATGCSTIVNPDTSAEEIDKIVARILENYPPAIKK